MYLIGASVFKLSASIFGSSSTPFVVGEVHCTGIETELLECSHNSIGHHLCGGSTEDANDVAIVCGMHLDLHTHKNTHCCLKTIYIYIYIYIYICFQQWLVFLLILLVTYNTSAGCEDGAIRLQGGLDSSNGRVEICKFRTWGAVCSDEWNDVDAKVVCRQLGYDPEGFHVYTIMAVRLHCLLHKITCMQYSGSCAYLFGHDHAKFIDSV